MALEDFEQFLQGLDPSPAIDRVGYLVRPSQAPDSRPDLLLWADRILSSTGRVFGEDALGPGVMERHALGVLDVAGPSAPPVARVPRRGLDGDVRTAESRPGPSILRPSSGQQTSEAAPDMDRLLDEAGEQAGPRNTLNRRVRFQLDRHDSTM
jgi:hypothetical protein